MTVFLDVNDNRITAGDEVTWQLDQDVIFNPETDSIWMVDADSDEGLYPVPDWDGQEEYQWTERFDGEGEYGRYLMTFTSGGTAVEGSEGVTIHVAAADDGGGGGGTPPPDQPPPVNPPPPGGGGGGGGGVSPPPTTGIPGVDGILQYIGDRIAEIGGYVHDLASRIGGEIGQSIEGLIPTTLEVLAGSNQALAGFVGAFNSNLIKAPDYWATMTAQLRSAFEATDQPQLAWVRDIFVPTISEFLDGPTDERLSKLEEMVDRAVGEEPTVHGAFPLIAIAAGLGGGLAVLGVAAIAATILHDFARAAVAANTQVIEQASFRARRPSLVSANEAFDLQRKGLLSRGDARLNAELLGLNDGLIDGLEEGSAPRLGALELLELTRRGALSVDDLDGGLQQIGYAEQERNMFRGLLPNLATISDQIRFLVREVYSGGQRQQLQLDADYPDAATEQFARLGIDEETAKNYWAAHWDLPSPTQGYDMLHRGLINQDELAQLLKALDYSPTWRDKLQQLSYHQFTRVDIRRMHKQGVIPDDGLSRAYQNIGYSPADADQLATFTIGLNADEGKQNKLAIASGMKNHIMGAYQSGVLGESDAETLLSTLGYDAEHIDAFIAESNYVLHAQRFNKIRGSVGRLFVSGFWQEDHARQALTDWGATAEQIEFLITDWNIDREFKTLSEEHVKQRDLTKAEIEEAYRDDIITEDDARTMLLHLGYDEDEVHTLIALTTFRLVKSRRSEAIATVHDAYVNRIIERGEASNQLDAVQMATIRRDGLLTKWTNERTGKQAHLSIAQLEEMVRREIISDDEATAELTQQHYSPQQIARLLRLWGSREQERKDKLEADIAAHIRHLSTQDIVRAYRASILDRQQSETALRELHYETAAIDTLLTLSPRELSAQQIMAAVKTGAITMSMGHDRLINLGYTEADAKVLLDTVGGRNAR